MKSNIQSLVTIFVVSCLILFLEMAIIRWLGCEIRILAYLQNVLLVTCFLGIGIGCSIAKREIRLIECIVPFTAIVAIIEVDFLNAIFKNISEQLSIFDDLVVWGQLSTDSLSDTILWTISGLTLLSVLLFYVCLLFIPLGQVLGRLLQEHPRTVVAYSSDILGSLLGVWLFVALSFYWTPPVVWFSLAVVLLLLLAMLLPLSVSRTGYLLLALTIGLLSYKQFTGMASEFPQTIWSPYQKITIDKERLPDSFGVAVNDIGYQYILNLSDKHIDTHSKFYDQRIRGYGPYDMPFRFAVPPKRVLIVGGGTGNDVAAALRAGAEHIVVVDIDPSLIHLGKKYHPEEPLSSPKVEIVVDDARAYFANSKDRFDIVLFGLLDAHTSASQGSIRLDHFVYTKESFWQASQLLNDGGLLFVKFFALHDYINQRLLRLVANELQTTPINFEIPLSAYGAASTVVAAGKGWNIEEVLSKDPTLREIISGWQRTDSTQTTLLPTDDWPYLYLRNPTPPKLFYAIAIILFAMFLILFYRNQTYFSIRSLKRHTDFFLLGFGFMLLEVANISRAAVFFGSTWRVTAFSITGILVMVLLANLVYALLPKKPGIAVYIGLVLSLLALFYFDFSFLYLIDYWNRAIAFSLIFSIPILLSGLIFISRFEAVEDKDQALAANLLGALLGGIFQSVAFSTGIAALFLIIAAAYCGVLPLRHRH